MECIFCHKDSSSSKSVEHIIPESLGNKEHILPVGYVCDECNHYFSIKLEKPLLSLKYFKDLRSRNNILTKKNKQVKHTLIFPEVLDYSEASIETINDGKLLIIDNPQVYEGVISGKIKSMCEIYISEPNYPDIIISRFLAKCAYEYFLYVMKQEKYDICVSEMLGKKNDVLKQLREYARYGKGTTWHYSQRRIYSEGALFYDSNEKTFYEPLHEMMLFTKEIQEYPNNRVEAEIYFVVAIGGIEYAICLSDPDISGYKEWVNQNPGKSPLFMEYETLVRMD